MNIWAILGIMIGGYFLIRKLKKIVASANADINNVRNERAQQGQATNEQATNAHTEQTTHKAPRDEGITLEKDPVTGVYRAKEDEERR